MYDLRESFCLEARATDQSAVYILLGHQARDIIGFDRASIKDTHCSGNLCGVLFRENAPDKRMHFLRLLRRRCASRANGPNRLVINDNTANQRLSTRWSPAQCPLTTRSALP